MAFVASYKYIQQLTTASDAVLSIVAAEFNILVCYQTPINSETPPLFPFSKSSEMLVATMVPKQDVGGLCNLGSFSRHGDARDATALTATSALPRFSLSHDVNPADRRREEYLPTTFRHSGMESVFSKFNQLNRR